MPEPQYVLTRSQLSDLITDQMAFEFFEEDDPEQAMEYTRAVQDFFDDEGMNIFDLISRTYIRAIKDER